jgi:integrase
LSGPVQSAYTALRCTTAAPEFPPAIPPMATPQKTAQGTWRIQLEVKGVRDSGTFPTKREAEAWRDKRSAELRAVATGRAGTVKTLDDALKRYLEEVVPDKRGWAKETVRIAAFRSSREHATLPLKKRLSDLTPPDLTAWRDARLKLNARGAVLRDMTLLSAVLEKCKEWGWVASNPMREVKRPQEPDHRERVITDGEVASMVAQLGLTDGPIRTVSQAVAVCFLVALETGMRAGELCGLTWDRVHSNYVQLTESTKAGKARRVPLSPKARALIDRMKGWDDQTVFGLQAQSLDALFRKARERAKLSGFTFHDSRHTAATHIAQRLHVLDLCKMFGWTDPKRAMIYYNPSVDDLAARLA